MRCTHPERDDDWFALRIDGYALGMRYRGGIVSARPLDRAPEEDDLLVVALDGQVDADTSSPISIRLWAPEFDLEGRQLALRLRSISSVAPLTVTNPDGLVVLGEVVDRLDAAEVEAMGDL